MPWRPRETHTTASVIAKIHPNSREWGRRGLTRPWWTPLHLGQAWRQSWIPLLFEPSPQAEDHFLSLLEKKKEKNRKVYARWFPSRIEQKSNQSCSQALHRNAEETPWITKTALDGEPKLLFCLGHLLTISVPTLLPFVWEYDQTASEHSRGQPGSTLHIPVALVLHREGIATVSQTHGNWEADITSVPM